MLMSQYELYVVSNVLGEIRKKILLSGVMQYKIGPKEQLKTGALLPCYVLRFT